MCGSIGEISPDPLEDDFYDNLNHHMDVVDYRQPHKRVWQQIALGSEDQLRQRVAWVLIQIMVVSSGLLHGSLNAEGNAMYFVRNAFNNYIGVLRAVSYHPKMVEMNMLVPHPDCSLYEEYKEERGFVHLDSTKLVDIDAAGSGQPCSKFSLNKHFSGYKQIYDEGKGLFFANAGHMPKPVMKKNYREEVKTQLFSHNTMETELYRVDAFKEKVGTGVLGRMLDKLEDGTYAITPIAISGTTIALAGDSTVPRPIDCLLVELSKNHGLEENN